FVAVRYPLNQERGGVRISLTTPRVTLGTPKPPYGRPCFGAKMTAAGRSQPCTHCGNPVPEGTGITLEDKGTTVRLHEQCAQPAGYVALPEDAEEEMEARAIFRAVVSAKAAAGAAGALAAQVAVIAQGAGDHAMGHELMSAGIEAVNAEQDVADAIRLEVSAGRALSAAARAARAAAEALEKAASLYEPH